MSFNSPTTPLTGPNRRGLDSSTSVSVSTNPFNNAPYPPPTPLRTPNGFEPYHHSNSSLPRVNTGDNRAVPDPSPFSALALDNDDLNTTRSVVTPPPPFLPGQQRPPLPPVVTPATPTMYSNNYAGSSGNLPRSVPMENAPSYHSDYSAASQQQPLYRQGSNPHSPQPSNPYQQQQTPNDYPDYLDSYHTPSYQNHDFPDDNKSFTSQTHLTGGGGTPQFGVGEVVPSQKYQASQYSAQRTPGFSDSPYNYPPPQMAQPQRPSSPSQQGGSAGWHQVRNNLLARRVVKHIPLHNGNLVMDVPVPKGVVPTNPGTLGAETGEMEKLRYSAATCDPDDFMRRKFTLRQYLYGRKTELFIVMTMYNEDATLLLRTLNGVIKNIAHLCSRNRSKTWGPGAWKKVVVCIVADGRKVVNQRVLKVLQLMGVYAEGIAKDTVAGKEVQAHIYEYTSQVVVSESGEVGLGTVPVQMIFCLKEQNKKKLNSHRWFFNAFGPLVKPNVCILLDVGTKPSGTSIYELYKVFEKHANVGGACGEIYADTGKYGNLLLNPLVAGQNFEYKMSNILDKPFESVFGLISVLPGAFSAYRYAAVANHPDGTGPLASYFHGELMNLPGAEASIFDRNKFLAEDRILAFEIVCKKNAKWRLQYVKSAKAGTDVPSGVAEFISQRRRWLNGSIFASFYALYSFYRIWTSGHNIVRMFFLQILTFYNIINLLFNWLSISSYYLAFYFLLTSATEQDANDPFHGAGDTIAQVFNKVYIAIIFIIIICSLGNRPQGSKAMYTLCIILLAICQGILLYCAGWTVYLTVPKDQAGWSPAELLKNKTFMSMAMSLMATYGLYLISSLMYLDPWHMLTSFIQYLFLLPSYVNILLIYAFCNLHDVSWGTKGDNGAAKDLGQVKLLKKDGEELAEVSMPTRQEDVEALWQQARSEVRVPEKQVKEKRSAETKKSDSDRTFRTNVVLFFLGSNLVVIMLFTSTAFTNWIKEHWKSGSGDFNPYLTAIFYAVLGLSVMRFIGCTAYLIFRVFGF